MKICAIKNKVQQVCSAQSIVDTCQDVYKHSSIKFGGKISDKTPQNLFSCNRQPTSVRSDSYPVKSVGGLL
jgi:hypothetical protein